MLKMTLFPFVCVWVVGLFIQTSKGQSLVNVNTILENIEIPIPATSFNGGTVKGRACACDSWFCPCGNYEIDVVVDIKSGVCKKTNVEVLEINPNNQNDDKNYNLDLNVDKLTTDCSFKTKIRITRTKFTFGISVGLITEAPPETTITAKGKNVKITHSLTIDNSEGFSNSFTANVLGLGTCSIPLENNNFEWGSLSLPLKFKLDLGAWEPQIYSGNYGGEVKSYLETNAKELVAPTVQELLCEQFTSLLDTLKGMIDGLEVLQEATTWVDPFVSGSILNMENALNPPALVQLVDFQNNALFKMAAEVFFSTQQSTAPTNSDPILETIQEVLEGVAGDQDLLDLVGSALDLTINRNSDNTFSTDVTSLMGDFVTDFFQFTNGEIDFGMELNQLTITGATPNEENQVLVFLGGQTIKLPEIDMDSVTVFMDLKLTMSLKDVADSLGLVYTGPTVIITDDVTATLTVSDVKAILAVLMAIDENALENLPFISVYNNPLECLLSIFWQPPNIPGSVFDAIYPTTPIQINNIDDAATDIIASMIEAVFPCYQRAFPPVVSNLLSDSFTTLFAPETCPGPNPSDQTNQVPFDFSSGIFSLITDFDDAVMLDILLGLFFEEETGKLVFNIFSTAPAVAIEMPTLDGVAHLVEITGNKVAIEIASPVSTTQLNLLQVNTASDGTQRQLDSAVTMEQVSLVVELDVKETFTELDTSAVNVKTNTLAVSFDISSLELSLGLFLKVLKYDVESIKLKQFVNLGCWLATMSSEDGGGITDIQLLFGSIDLTATCTSCQSTIMTQVTGLLNGPEAQLLFENLVNSVSSGVADAVKSTFSGTNLQNLIDEGSEQCANGEGDLSLGRILSERLLQTGTDLLTQTIFDVLAGTPGVIIDPFVDTGNGIPALDAQNGLDPALDLLDWTEGNIGTVLFNSLFGTKYPLDPLNSGTTSSAFLNQVVTILDDLNLDTGITGVLDLLITFLELEDDIDSDGIITVDPLEIIGRFTSLNTTADGTKLFSIETMGLVIELYGQSGGNISTEINISNTDGLEYLAAQTIKFPQVKFSGFSSSSELTVRFVINDLNQIINLGTLPASFEIKEVVTLQTSLSSLSATAAALLAISIPQFESLQIGPLQENLLDCALSAFASTPALVGFLLDVEGFTLATGGGFLGQLLNFIIPTYLYKLPDVATALGQKVFAESNPIASDICPSPNPADKAVPFDFTSGIFGLITDGSFDDAILVDTLLGLFFETDSLGTKFVYELLQDADASITLELPNLDGVDQNITITGNRVALEIMKPLNAENINILEPTLDPDGGNRLLKNSLSLEGFEIKLDLDIDWIFKEKGMAATVEKNNVVLSFNIENLALALDVYLKVTKYDIDSMQIAQIFNLGCWFATLDSSGGGITNLALLFDQIKITSNCFSCENSMIEEIALLFNGAAAQAAFENLVSSVASGLGSAIKDTFSGANLQSIIDEGGRQCASGEGDLGNLLGPAGSRILQESATSFTDAFLAILAGEPGIIINPFESVDGTNPAPALLLESLLDPNIDILNLQTGGVGAVILNTFFGTDFEENTGPVSDEFVNTMLGIVDGIEINTGVESILDFLLVILEIDDSLQADGKTVTFDLLKLLARFIDVDVDPLGYGLFKYSASGFTLELFSNGTNITTEVEMSSVEGLDFLGDQTIKFPSLEFSNLGLDSDLSVRLVVEDLNQFIDLGTLPAALQIEEGFTLTLNVDSLKAVASALIAVSLDSLKEMELGPLLDYPLDCVLASFVEIPSLTGLMIEVAGVQLATGGGFIGQVFDVILPQYQTKLPDIVNLIMRQVLGDSGNIPLASSGAECPTVSEDKKSIPFDFQGGIFGELKVYLNEADSILDLLFNDNSKPEEASLSFIGEGNKFEVPFSLPQAGGKSLDVYFAINKLSLGLKKPFNVDDFSFLEVDTREQWAEFFPQGLMNSLNLRDAFIDIQIQLDIGSKGSSSGRLLVDENATGLEENVLDLKVNFEQLVIGLMLWAKTSEYAVFSMPLESLTSLSCWVSLLEKPGGIKSLNVTLSNLTTEVGCDPCQTGFMQSLADSFADPNGWDELNSMVNSAVRVFTKEIEKEFAGQRWDETIGRAVESCANNDGSISFTTQQAEFEFTEFKKSEYGAAITISSVFGGLALGALFLGKWYNRRMKSAAMMKNPAHLVNAGVVEETTSMVRNERLPKWQRYLTVGLILVNIGMFVYGDTQLSFVIGAEAKILDQPLEFGTIGEFSVISSIVSLYEGGAIYLAVMLFFLAIFWPYFKLTTMLCCLFLPPRFLKPKWRGYIIHVLDMFGKYSFVEVYFVAFVLAILRLEINNPSLGFLPSDGSLFAFKFIIEPKAALFVFLGALCLSLLLSNYLLRFHSKIVEEEEDADDHKKSVYERTNLKMNGKVAKLAVVISCLLNVLGCILLILSYTMMVMRIDISGLAKLLIELEGNSPSIKVTIAMLLEALLKSGEFGEMFLAFFVVMTLVVMPMITCVYHMVFVFARVTRKTAIYMNDIRHILQSWSAVEIFIIAILFTVFELGVLTENIVTQEQCQYVGDSLAGVLLPLGFVDESDVKNACFKATAYLEFGTYCAIAGVLILFLRNYLLSPYTKFDMPSKTVNPSFDKEDVKSLSNQI